MPPAPWIDRRSELSPPQSCRTGAPINSTLRFLAHCVSERGRVRSAERTYCAMKKAQVIGISIALGAGLLAFVGMRGLLKTPPKPVIQAEKIDAVQVLVARSDIGLGQFASDSSFRWQDWPRDAVSSGFHHQGQEAERDARALGRHRPLADPVRRADHRHQVDQGRQRRRACRDPAAWHARHLHQDLGAVRRRQVDSSQRPRGRDPDQADAQPRRPG